MRKMIPNITDEIVEKQKSLQSGTCLGFGLGFKIPLIVKMEMPDPSPLSKEEAPKLEQAPAQQQTTSTFVIPKELEEKKDMAPANEELPSVNLGIPESNDLTVPTLVNVVDDTSGAPVPSLSQDSVTPALDQAVQPSGNKFMPNLDLESLDEGSGEPDFS